MALPLTGTITSAMILTELGFSGSSNVLRNVVQKPGGILQVLVNSTWVNLNMCSPYLPTPFPPYIVPTHWYGYDHGTSGVEIITISGDATIDVGQTVTYTATLTGDNLTGVVLTWYRFEANSWTAALNTGNSTTVTWLDPRNAKIKVVASNICNLNIVEKELNISYNCLPKITGDPYIGGTLEVNKSYDVWAVNGSGIVGEPGNTRLGITFFWEVFGSVQIISGQGTNKVVIRATATSTNNIIKVIIGSCGETYTSSNIAFDAASPITVYYNTAQSRSIQKICPSGTVGSYVTVTRAAGTHSSTVSVADANNAANTWLYGQEAQDIAQTNGTCGDTPQYPNDRMSQVFTKNNCPSGQTGTVVEYVVPAGTFYASSVSAANTLAQNDINANGQNAANSGGVCNSTSCPLIVTGLSLSGSAGSGYVDVTLNITVSASGVYNITGMYGGGGAVNLPAGTTSIVQRISVTGTYNDSITVSSYCSSITASIGPISVSGGAVCTTVGAFNGAATRSGFTQGYFNVYMNMSPYQNIRNVSGNIQFAGDTYYFSGLDFSGGNTVYETFSIPFGTTKAGTMTFNITGGDNICNLPLTYNNLSYITVISPS